MLLLPVSLLSPMVIYNGYATNLDIFYGVTPSRKAVYYINVCVDLRVQVNVSISSRDSYCIEVVLRCLAIKGDGLGPHNANDGGILSAVAAAGFKGSDIYGTYFSFTYDLPPFSIEIWGCFTSINKTRCYNESTRIIKTITNLKFDCR
jgi:hypothetical protein